MIQLGDLLKNKRAERGLEVSQVSESTKIPQKLITSLENGDYESFASEVYLKGLLRNYARFLELDEKKVFAIYRRERKENKKNVLSDSYKPIEPPKAVITPARIVFLVTAVIVIAIIAFIVVQVNRIIQPPTLELSEPLVAAAPGDVFTEVDGDSIVIAGIVEVGSKLIINGNEVTTNNLQEFRVDNYKLNPGSNEIFIIAQSYYFSTTTELKLTVLSNQGGSDQGDQDEESSEDQGDQTDEDAEEDIVESMNIDIAVENEDAWLVVTVDEETKVEQVVTAGTTYTFEANDVFTIYSPRPQVVTLKINEEEYTFSSQSASKFRIENGAIVQE